MAHYTKTYKFNLTPTQTINFEVWSEEVHDTIIHGADILTPGYEHIIIENSDTQHGVFSQIYQLLKDLETDDTHLFV